MVPVVESIAVAHYALLGSRGTHRAAGIMQRLGRGGDWRPTRTVGLHQLRKPIRNRFSEHRYVGPSADMAGCTAVTVIGLVLANPVRPGARP